MNYKKINVGFHPTYILLKSKQYCIYYLQYIDITILIYICLQLINDILIIFI